MYLHVVPASDQSMAALFKFPRRRYDSKAQQKIILRAADCVLQGLDSDSLTGVDWREHLKNALEKWAPEFKELTNCCSDEMMPRIDIDMQVDLDLV